MHCPNINSPEWKNLISKVSKPTAYSLWNKYEGNVPQSAIDESMGTITEDLSGLKEANATLDSTMKTILAQIGVKYEAVDEILGPKGVAAGPIAKADLLKKVVQIVEGKADKTTLTEETVHFLVAMLDPESHVYKSMYELITKYDMYQQVIQEYGNVPGYTDEKIRREAIAKVITREIVNNFGESTMSASQQKTLYNWWNMLLSKVKQIMSSFDNAKLDKALEDYSPFKQLAYKIANQNLEDFGGEITDTGTYYQLSNQGNAVQQAEAEKIKALSKGISKEGTNDKRGYFKDGNKLGKSVTERRDEKFQRKFKQEVNPEFEKLKVEAGYRGNLVHDDLDNISKRILSKDATVAKVVKTNPIIYAKLEKFIEGLQKLHGEDAIYLSEQIIYDPKTNTPGTVDLIVIDKDGVKHIYDWKTMTLSKKEKEEYGEPSHWKTQKYEYQLNSYKDIMENNGVTNFGKIRYIPIEIILKKDKNTGQTFFADIDIGLPGGRSVSAAKPYLNPVPVSNEKTGEPAIDKLLTQLLALQREVRNKKSNSAAEDAKKNQRIISLNKAIRDLQLNKNLGLFAESATIQFKGIEARIADTKTPFSENELVDMREQLEVYTDLSSKFATLYENNKIPAEHVTKFDQISGKAARLKVVLDSKLEAVFKEAAMNAGLSEEKLKAYKEKGAKPIGLMGKLTTALSRIDHPIFQTFWNLVNKAKTQIKRDSDALQKEIEEKLTALKKAGAAKGLKGTAIFNSMVDKKKGKLISKYSSDYYSTRKQRIEKNDSTWIKENSVIDQTGLRKYIEDQEKFIKTHVFSSDDKYNKKIRETKLAELNEINIFTNPNAYAKLASNSFTVKFVKPSDKWLSNEYKALRQDKEAFEFYELFTNKMKEFSQFMPFSANEGYINPERFIPNLRADLVEKALSIGGEGVISGLGKDFSDMFDYNLDEELTLGQINEFTGEYQRQVPVYYTKEIDPAEKSYDLGRVLYMFGNKAYNYKYISEIEGTTRNLRNALADSSEALVDGNGKLIKNLLVKNKVVSADTLDTFDKFVNYYVYGVKESEDYGYFTKQKKVINPKTGEEEIVEVKYSNNKIAKGVLKTFAAKALGLNLVSGGAQMFGNNFNSLILAVGGKQFGVKDWVAAKGIVTSGNFNPEAYQFLQVLDIRGDNQIYKKADTLSVHNTARGANLEKAFFLYEYGDNALFKTISIALARSHGIDANGKLKRLTKLPEGTPSLYDSLKNNENGVSNITKLMSEDEFRKFRNKAQAMGEKLTGMSSRDNMSGWRLSIAGQSLMQFRGWIPRTLGARFGSARFDAELEAVEQGRFRTLFREIVTRRVIPLTSVVLKTATAGQFGGTPEDSMELLYNEFMSENPHLSREEVTKEMFADMHTANVKSALMEISLYLAFTLLIMGLKEGWDDDDDDKRFRSETLKTLNRFSDEIGFYLNPNSFQAITKGAVPAIGLFTDMGRFFGDTFGEAKGQLLDDEVSIHNNKPLWAFMRAFVPGGTTMWNWFGDKSVKQRKKDEDE
jgi:hypothetical protein